MSIRRVHEPRHLLRRLKALAPVVGILALTACAGPRSGAGRGARSTEIASDAVRADATKGRTVPGVEASLVLTGGRVWTGDRTRPEASAVAIRDGRFVVVGSDEEALAAVGSGTLRIDLQGRRVVPGFIDSHVHVSMGGAQLLAPDLRLVESEEEFARRLGEYARELEAGTWVTEGAWDHERWPDARLPTRAALDRHTPDHPVLVSRIDGHMALANSLALEIAGVDARTIAPAGGSIERDESGQPTGVLKDNAISLVGEHVPAPSPGVRIERVRAALAHAAEHGVTGLHDMLDSFEPLEIYQRLRDAGELSARITIYAPIAGAELLATVGLRRGFGDSLLRINGVKAFSDGSLGSSTAYFFDAYLDSPGNYGLALGDLSRDGLFETEVQASGLRGLQPATHAIGDRANRAVLDIYERLERLHASSRGELDSDDLRPRVEHAQHLHPDDVERFGALGVVPSMQPYHLADDGRWAEKRIGAERARTTYAFRRLLDSGAALAFGSDWPVAPLSPLLGIQAAVTRETLDGAHPGGWVPEEKITVEEALRAYTLGSAHAGFAEDEVGSIEVGKLADLVVLDRDILAIDAAGIAEAQVVLTIVGGDVVFAAE